MWPLLNLAKQVVRRVWLLRGRSRWDLKVGADLVKALPDLLNVRLRSALLGLQEFEPQLAAGLQLGALNMREIGDGGQEKPAAYLCRNFTCSPPATTWAELARHLG